MEDDTVTGSESNGRDKKCEPRFTISGELSRGLVCLDDDGGCEARLWIGAERTSESERSKFGLFS